MPEQTSTDELTNWLETQDGMALVSDDGGRWAIEEVNIIFNMVTKNSQDNLFDLLYVCG